MTETLEEAKRIGTGELRSWISDAGELRKGAELYDKGQLLNLSRHRAKLFCDAKGSGASPYKVMITYADKPIPTFKAQCSCPAAVRGRGRGGFCKHGAALMVAWARAPESFLVSNGPAPGAVASSAASTGASASPGAASPGAPKRNEVKKGKVSAQELMRAGVEQVGTLVRELGVAGVASLSEEREEQVQLLGQTLRENRLRRLSARTIELGQLLGAARTSGATVMPGRYTGLLADLLLTARKLEKHLGGEPLEDRHVEELIGKTWQKGDRVPVRDLQLVEYAFITKTTSDGFVVRESRFFDIASGLHHSEKQILPAAIARRTEPKPSRAGYLLAGARGTTFPGFAPHRIDFDDLGDGRLLDPSVYAAMVEKALPGAGAALAALQEHRKDIFAPDRMPVALRVDALLFRGNRLEAVDDQGNTLHLPEDQALEERLAGALHAGKLRALVGDMGIDAALATLWPAAAIIEGPLGLELRGVMDADGERKVALEGSAWVVAARAAGISGAAIALGEVREELADLFLGGLSGLTARRTEPLALRLEELGLSKQAALLRTLALKPEPSERLDDFIKLYQVLEIALVRLTAAAHVDRATVVAVPTYAGVYVHPPEELLEPGEVTRRRAQGTLNRYQAAIHYARYYEALPPEALVTSIFPIWADGAAAPHVMAAFASRPEEGIEAAAKALSVTTARMARITAVRVLEGVGLASVKDRQRATFAANAELMLRQISRESRDGGVRALARAALDAIEVAQVGSDVTVRRRKLDEQRQVEDLCRELLTAPKREERLEALRQLEHLGIATAIPAIRQAFWSDASTLVRDDACHVLAMLGDSQMVEVFVRMLASRAEDEHSARVAAQALGLLGDVRGLDELLSAYAEGYKPGIMMDAIRRFGPVALEPLVALVEARPEIATRQAALSALQALDDKELADFLTARLKARRGQADLPEKAQISLRLAEVHVYTRRAVASVVKELLAGEETPDALRASRNARKVLG
ncbi:HEAT repeat domain-containing protein [Chondromyces crocatus]|uniref:SWIM-type domain-containing protein n=1 Tax=Chondromyces crocatus TaxID=52 RepID=A0A0K1E5Y6_CHOCO|nr:HEAT repeat domain-containing protein [Chondromyces crocatus]AKT36082.1 uncharacterized protein CMC5_001950 [Chondromyces crocatus]